MTLLRNESCTGSRCQAAGRQNELPRKTPHDAPQIYRGVQGYINDS